MDAAKWDVRPMEPRDVEAVLEIQSQSPEAAQWRQREYSSLTAGLWRADGWVTSHQDRVRGFLVARRAGDEYEILNLGVAPSARRRGVASLLLRRALTAAFAGGAHVAHLELRASNAAALSFYARHGFAPVARRRAYYSSPVEDAVLLRKDLP